MAQDQQIQGLPEGAELRPIQGLPEGAELRPMGNQPPVSKPSPPQPGFLENLGHTFGIGTQEAQERARHPIRSMVESYPPVALGESLYGGAKRITGELGQAVQGIREHNPAAAGVHAIQAIPFVGAGMEKMASELPAKQGAYDLGDITGGQVGTAVGTGLQVAPMLLGAADTAFPGRPTIGTPGASIAERIRGYKSPVIPTEIQNASKVAKAIRPVGGVGPDLESNLATQLPHIRAFAEESGNPLHSQWEAAQAARGLGERGLGHYQERILEPFKDAPISMRTVPEYQGNVSGEGRMTTLGDINARISDINDMTRGPMGRAKTVGQQMSEMERLGLENEGGKLRSILYKELSRRTGIPEEDIKSLREGYGQQFSIADTIDAARRARLGPQGASAEGGSVPLSKVGAIDKLVTALRGGQDFLANRNFRKAAAPFEARPITYPEPGPPPEMAASRKSLAEARGIEVEPNPIRAEPVSNPEQVSTRNRSLARRELGIDQQRQAAMDAEQQQAARLEQMLQKGRQTQEAAKTLRKKSQ